MDGPERASPEAGELAPLAASPAAIEGRTMPLRHLRGLVLSSLLLALACGDGGVGPEDGPDEQTTRRTFRMGFAPTPPYATTESVIRTVEEMAEVSELALVQQHVPWAQLLDGTQTMEQALDELENLVDFLRAHDLGIVFLLDPLDGLDRRREPPDLLARGRSIMEAEIRELHDTWAVEVARRVRPEWYGLASEINTLAALGDPALYGVVRDLVNDLSPRLRAASPDTRTFVSFQADQAYGLPGFPQGGIDHLALVQDYDVDGLGLSTYPVFVLDTPAHIPDDFFARFRSATDLPLLLVEGGWNSEDTPLTRGTPEEQVDFFRRMSALLDGVDAEVWVFLMYTDLALETWGLPPDREQGLRNFSRMGIVDREFRPKPAFAVWDSVFNVPLAPRQGSSVRGSCSLTPPPSTPTCTPHYPPPPPG